MSRTVFPSNDWCTCGHQIKFHHEQMGGRRECRAEWYLLGRCDCDDAIVLVITIWQAVRIRWKNGEPWVLM